MNVITSRNNPLIIETSKLHDRKHREEKGECIFEGKKLLDEAMASNMDIINIFVDQKTLDKHPELYQNEKVILVNDSVAEKLSENKKNLGVKVRARKGKNVTCNTDSADAEFILCGIQDPGNVGTIIRSAKAMGIKSVILSDDCADVWSEKTIRSSMGAVFGMKITYVSDMEKAVKTLINNGKKVYAAALDRKAKKLSELEGDKTEWCFAVGNEGHGLSADFISLCTGTVFIPMSEGSESLNVSAAAAILLWQKYN